MNKTSKEQAQPVSEIEYKIVMNRIETLLQKSTKGGLEKLSSKEKIELEQLAHLAEKYEDAVPMMPLDKI